MQHRLRSSVEQRVHFGLDACVRIRRRNDPGANGPIKGRATHTAHGVLIGDHPGRGQQRDQQTDDTDEGRPTAAAAPALLPHLLMVRRDAQTIGGPWPGSLL